MDRSTYPLNPISELSLTFISEGPRGKIRKHITFKPFANAPSVFSLGLGDELADGTLSDITITDNKDLENVIGSVAAAIDMFLNSFPTRSVFIKGSTESRTRLYRIILSRAKVEISNRFLVYGLLNEMWEDYQSDRPYTAFLIASKS